MGFLVIKEKDIVRLRNIVGFFMSLKAPPSANQRAVVELSSTPVGRYNVMLLGDNTPGRMALVEEMKALHIGPLPTPRTEEYSAPGAPGCSSWDLLYHSCEGLLVGVTLNDVSNMWGDWNRPYKYDSKADAAILCFSLRSNDTLNSVRNKWFPEIFNNKRGVPCFLVGLNHDIPTSPYYKHTPVTHQQGIQAARDIGAVYYYEVENASAVVKSLISRLVHTLQHPISCNTDKWESLELSYTSYGHVCSVHNDHLYIFGGGPNSAQTTEGISFDLNSRTRTSMSDPRGECTRFPAHCASSDGRYVYFYGGRKFTVPVNSFNVFDAENHSWNKLNPPVDRPATYGASLCLFRNSLFLFGGSHDPGASSSLYVYKLDTQTWSAIPPRNAAPEPRYHHSAFVKGNKMFILCGIGEKNVKYNDVWTTNLLEASAFGRATWVKVTCQGTPPTPQRGHAGCLLTEDMFMFVGSTNSNPSAEFFKFDTNTFTWTKLLLPYSPRSREFFGIASWRQHVILIGGMIRDTSSAVLSDCHISFTPSLFATPPKTSASTTTNGASLVSSSLPQDHSSPVQLPQDCWVQITSYLEPETICLLGAVSRTLYKICVSDLVWRRFLPVEFHSQTCLKTLCIPMWKNATPLAAMYNVPRYTGPESPSCFLGDGQILMADGTTKPVRDVEEGDCVMTELMRGRKVEQVRAHHRSNPLRLVFLNGVGLTTGHPIWQVGHQPNWHTDAGEWVRACDSKSAEMRVVENPILYDFVLAGGPVVCLWLS
ncbi:hypothetical protein Pelo_2368 [Pelomyxa schiedti]|nr:hypothetical protein Pelo_2368 [Pelomyxa schiedti]